MIQISITGLDGCGKSTQAKLLKNYLPNARIVSVWDIIKRPEFQSWSIYKMPPDVEQYVYNLHPLSRSFFIFHAFNEAYQKALQSGADYLIFDGNWYKYWAVEQAMGAPENLGDLLNKQYPNPDYNFYLQLPVSKIIKRKKNISIYEGGDKNRLDNFVKIQTKTKDILEKILPENTIVIDGEQTKEVIHQDILKHIKL